MDSCLVGWLNSADRVTLLASTCTFFPERGELFGTSGHMTSTKDLVLVATRISQGKKRGAGKKRARLWARGFNIETMAVYSI